MKSSSEAVEVSRRPLFVPDSLVVQKARRLDGTVTAPPSKSYSHRALMVAGLCDGEVYVENPLQADDIDATADAWRALGAQIEFDHDLNRYHVRGVSRPFLSSRPSRIFVKESGTTLRFLLPGLAFASHDVRVEGKQSLKLRPNQMIVKPLRELGVKLEGQGEEHLVPITVHGSGFLPAGEVRIPGGKSSQVVSAFLLWLPLASSRRPAPGVVSRLLGSSRNDASIVRVDGTLVSKPYVDVTIDALRRWAGIVIDELEPGSVYRIPAGQKFAPTSRSFVVNGDYSSAAFLLAAACLCNADIRVKGLQKDRQGDREIVSILTKMGAEIEELDNSIRIEGPSKLKGVELDCSRIPDLVPILCVLGAFAEGRTTLKNIAHLRYKESNRIESPTEELRKLGARISSTHDSITIEKSSLAFGEVSARQDHRMAMSLIVAGLAGNGVKIHGTKSIKKSYPSFVQDMESLGAEIGQR